MRDDNGFHLPISPICKVATRTPQSRTNDAFSWDYAVVDPYGMWRPSDPKRIWIPVDGLYEVSFNILQNGTVAAYDPGIGLNFMGGAFSPAVVIAYTYVSRMNVGAYSNLQTSILYPLKANDYLTVCTQRTLGINQATDVSPHAASYFWAMWVDRL